MKSTAHATIQAQTEIDGERLELAVVIYELYSQGLIAEEIDPGGTPRFRPTGKKPRRA